MKTKQTTSRFCGILLIPAENKFGGSEYPYTHYKGYILGKESEETKFIIHILFFNCLSSEKIPPLVDLEIKTLEKYLSENPYVKEIEHQIEFFLNLKKELSNKKLHHPPTDELIQVISEKYLPEVQKENLIFLCGVERIV